MDTNQEDVLRRIADVLERQTKIYEKLFVISRRNHILNRASLMMRTGSPQLLEELLEQAEIDLDGEQSTTS